MPDRIFALNPQIADPDLILVGETVVVPLQKTLLQAGAKDQLHDAAGRMNERPTQINSAESRKVRHEQTF
jgi:hypothetical protein